MALKIEISPCVTECCFCKIPLWLYMETESFSTSSSQLLSCGIFSITAVLHFINTIKRQNSCITLSIRRRLHLHWGRKFIHLKSPHLQRDWMKTHPKRDPPLLFLIFCGVFHLPHQYKTCSWLATCSSSVFLSAE